MEPELKYYTMAEVQQHTAATSCWIILDKKVYDVTKFLDDHPGGGDLIVDEAGTDATTAFKDASHSKDAKDMRKDYYIGELKPDDFAVVQPPQINSAVTTPKQNESKSKKGCCTVL